MLPKGTVLLAVASLTACALLGVAFAASAVVTSALFQGKEPAAAAKEVLTASLAQAKDGSWERLAVARAHYLGGQKEQGQTIIDGVVAGKPEASDYRRILRIYGEAKEWDRVRATADKLVAMSPKDADDLAEAGAWLNLTGDREKAEALFVRALEKGEKDVWVSAMIGGSYLGVMPLAQ